MPKASFQKKAVSALAVLVLLVFGYLAARWFAVQKAAERVDEALAGMSMVVRVNYGELDVGLFSRALELKDVEAWPHISNGPITARKFVLYSPKEKGEGKTEGRFAVRGLELDFRQTLFSPIRPPFIQMGYNKILADFDCSYIQDRVNRTLVLDGVRLRVKEAGEAELTAYLTGVDFSGVSGGLGGLYSLKNVLDQVAIGSLEFHYEDDSLYPRYQEFAARQINRTRKQAVDDEVRYLQLRMLRLADGKAKKSLAGWIEFMREPRSITVLCEPLRPVGIKLLGTIADTVEFMNILEMEIKP